MPARADDRRLMTEAHGRGCSGARSTGSSDESEDREDDRRPAVRDERRLGTRSRLTVENRFAPLADIRSVAPVEKIDAITTAKDVVACESLNVVVSRISDQAVRASVADDRVIRGASPAGIDVLYRGQCVVAIWARRRVS